MIKSIRHLCGTTADWSNAYSYVIPRGELAVEYLVSGETVVRIGDGVTAYSSLTPINRPRVVSCTGNEVTLAANSIFLFSSLTHLHIKMPSVYDQTFSTELFFISGNDATEISFSLLPNVSGDDCADNLFLPKPNKRYTLWIWYSDSWNAVVRSTDNA